MKKLIILLISVLAVGAVSLILLTHHSDLQVKLSQTLTTDKEDTAAPDEEPVVVNEEITIDFSKGKMTFLEWIPKKL